MCLKAPKLKGLIVQIDSFEKVNDDARMVYKDVNAIVIRYLYITSSLIEHDLKSTEYCC